MITIFLLWFIVAGVFALMAFKGKREHPYLTPMPTDAMIWGTAFLWPVTIPIFILVRLADKFSGYDRENF